MAFGDDFSYDEISSPTKKPKIKTSGEFGSDFNYDNVPVEKTLVTVEKNKGFLDKIESFLKKKKTPTMEFKVGEGLTPEQTTKAYETIQKPVIPVGQEIKAPFVPKGVVVPRGDGVGVGYSVLKSLIEFPEKATRTLTTDFGKSRQKEEKQWRVPSYSEITGKEVGQLIDEGMPPTAAVILGSAKVGGEFANDALIFESIFGSALKGVVTKVAKNEASTLAYDFLGRPKTLIEAEKNFKNIQKEFHPDISGSDVMSKQANNAITILRKEGIPSQNIIKKGVDAILNRPLSSLFKTKSKVVTPKITSKLIPERTPIQKELDQLVEQVRTKPTTKVEIIKPVIEKPKEYVDVYHGGEKIEKVDLGKSNYGKTFFVTDKPEYAQFYANKYKEAGTINNLKLDKDAKLIDIKNATPEEITTIKNKIQEIKDAHVPYSGEGGFNHTFGGSVDELLEGAIRGKAHFAEDPALVDVYKQLGYDGMVSYENGAGLKGGAKNIGIWNENIIKISPEISKIKYGAPKEVVKVPGEQLPVGGGELKISRLEARIKGKLGKITPEEAEKAGMITYKQMNKAETIAKSRELVSKSPQDVLDILEGKKSLPEGQTYGGLGIAAEESAEMVGNIDLISKLASLRATRYGQEISILTEADPLSIVNQVKEIKIARETAVQKQLGKRTTTQKAKSNIIEKGKKEVKTIRMKIEDAQKLLDSLIC